MVVESSDTREKIKRTARHLFTERGVGNVSIREILTAAGQRNVGAVGYYFRNKEALVREILRDGALLIDKRRSALLDALETDNATLDVHNVIAVIVQSSIDLEDEPDTQTYIRFFTMIRQHDPASFADAIIGSLDNGFKRCIAHLHRLCADLPPTIFRERIGFMMLMMGAGLSARELALDPSGADGISQLFGGPASNSESFVENLIDACEGVLRQPVSLQSLASFAP